MRTNILSALNKVSPFAAKKHLMGAVNISKANVTQTAKILRVSIPTLYVWIKKLKLQDELRTLVKLKRFKPKSGH